MSLAGKRILVTGGSTGIGSAAAVRVANAGATVAILDLNEESGASTLERIRDSGADARFWRVDVSDEGSVANGVDEAVSWLGCVDVLLHCAGIMRGQGTDIRELSSDVWATVLAVNLSGSFFVAKHVARHMIAAGSGVLVLVSSVGGVISGSGSYAYGASKGGMHGLALTLEMHLGPQGIRVHEVCPDRIDTPLFRRSVEEGLAQGIDPKRYAVEMGTAEGLAELMAFVASDEASYLPLTIVGRHRTSVAAP